MDSGHRCGDSPHEHAGHTVRAALCGRQQLLYDPVDDLESVFPIFQEAVFGAVTSTGDTLLRAAVPQRS